MPPRIPTHKRQAILEAIKNGGTCRGIAREHNVSEHLVRKVAKEANVNAPWSRAQTKNAIEANLIDAKARRAEISRQFLEKAAALLEQIDQPHLVYSFGGKDNIYNEQLIDKPSAQDIRNLMTSAAVAFDKHMAAEKHDTDDSHGFAAVDQWLRNMVKD